MGQYGVRRASLYKRCRHSVRITEQNIKRFLDNLPETFYADADEGLTAIRHGRSFNAIYMPMAFKFDFFLTRYLDDLPGPAAPGSGF